MNNNMASGVIPVRVALRCRPFVHKEIAEGCRGCLEFIEGEPQVILGRNKAFTYDYTYSSESTQTEVYKTSIQPLISNIFNGYNATVLAYGQTGSGKTYTMGTTFLSSESENLKGIIPRVIYDIFKHIDSHPDWEFYIKVSFLEIYNEDVLDLLSKNKVKEEVNVRDDGSGDIKITGLTEIQVSTPKETFQCLQNGTLMRTTGATAMNLQSSRSHAVFTLTIEQRSNDGEKYTRSKFHLVDLAGSEKAKKTLAQGERFKEGVNINLGLLALGNVISALCDESTPSPHIPYRNSKLTRLLQDSLGGNSHTVMIACVSPADSNMEETLNTLRYADRARKIKNKPVVNRDPQAAELARLKQLVQQLQIQLLNSRTNLNDSGGNSESSENVKFLLERNQVLENENHKLARELQGAIDQTTALYEKALMSEMAREKMKQKLDDLLVKANVTVESLNNSAVDSNENYVKNQVNLVLELKTKVEEIKDDQLRHDNFASEVNESHQPLNETWTKEEVDDENENSHVNAEHTLRQAEINRQLHELNKALQKKEELVGQMTANDSQLNCMKEKYENAVRDLENEILKLQKEKEELADAVRLHSSNSNNKLSEQRRKRLQELESHISNLKKKVIENSRMAKMKEQSDQKVVKLNGEILEMKNARVKLIRQLKDESEKFRQWRQEKDKEVAQLKMQERKRQYEIVKMERMHSKQQNVLKRKMEEAVSVNRRLKDALALQKTAAERRLQEQTQFSQNGGGVRLRKWLQQELELVVSTKEAEHHLQFLLNDRKNLHELLGKLQIEVDEQQNSFSESETIDELNQKILSVQNDLDLRNIQIADLQQKILDSNQDEKSKHLFDGIQTMQEAKCAMRYLFDEATNAKFENCLKSSESNDLLANYEEAQKTSQDFSEIIETMKQKHKKELLDLQQENEEKILFLLKQLPTCNQEKLKHCDSDLRKRLIFQEQEIERLSTMHEHLQEKIKECEDLKNALTEAQSTKENKYRRRSSKFAISGGYHKKQKITFENITSSSEDERDDDEGDPEWRQTPLYKRLQQMKNKSARFSKIPTMNLNEEIAETKQKKPRFSNLFCSCKGNCTSKICSCKKNQRSCSNCKCSLSCMNKDTLDTMPGSGNSSSDFKNELNAEGREDSF